MKHIDTVQAKKDQDVKNMIDQILKSREDTESTRERLVIKCCCDC